MYLLKILAPAKVHVVPTGLSLKYSVQCHSIQNTLFVSQGQLKARGVVVHRHKQVITLGTQLIT